MKRYPILLVGLALAACNSPMANPTICAGPAAVSHATASAKRVEDLKLSRISDQARLAVEERWTSACLQRWAYRLRRSKASHGDLQDAVIGACETERSALLRVSNDAARTDAWLKRRAAFFLVQGQLGACKAPKP